MFWNDKRHLLSLAIVTSPCSMCSHVAEPLYTLRLFSVNTRYFCLHLTSQIWCRPTMHMFDRSVSGYPPLLRRARCLYVVCVSIFQRKSHMNSRAQLGMWVRVAVVTDSYRKGIRQPWNVPIKRSLSTLCQGEADCELGTKGKRWGTMKLFYF
jgi:hypothetical protein